MAKAPIIETHMRSRVRKAEKRNFAWQVMKGLLRLLALGILIALVWYVTRLQFFTITNIQVEGGETVPLNDIREKVETELVGTYFLIIPKRFTYLYPHDRIVEVVDAYDRIHSVVVKLVSRTALSVHFDEYAPHALWCGDGESPTCYFITESGYAFGEAPQLNGGAFVRHVKEGISDTHEGDVFERERLKKLDTFLTRLHDELGFRVSSILHKENGDATLYVNGGGTLYITLDGNFDTTFDHLKGILMSEEFKHIEPGNFQYIDVRFDKKAYVNEEPPQEMNSSTTATTTLPEL